VRPDAGNAAIELLKVKFDLLMVKIDLFEVRIDLLKVNFLDQSVS
jgi:hypothetical protein